MSQRIFVVSMCAAATVACGVGTGTESPSAAKRQLVVFHTQTQVHALKVEGPLDAKLRQKVEDFYPAACLDVDGDDDGVPASLDQHEGAGAEDALGCRRCNRGPGTEGDFRLELSGSNAELDRGRVSAREGKVLTVPSPDGAIEIAIADGARMDDGDPLPGAEIRIEGQVQQTSPLKLVATRVKVLCPAPGMIPEGELPSGTEPIPSDDAPPTGEGDPNNPPVN